MDIVISFLDIVKKKPDRHFAGPVFPSFIQQQFGQFFPGSNNGCGPVLGEEGLVPEAPADRDTGQPGIVGGLDVHIGVADVHRTFRLDVQLGQGAEDGVGAGLRATPWDSPNATSTRSPK